MAIILVTGCLGGCLACWLMAGKVVLQLNLHCQLVIGIAGSLCEWLVAGVSR